MKQEIMKLLGWTELEYTTFQYETGLAYLREYIHGDNQGIAALERSRIFWAWWRNHFIQRDAMFVHEHSGTSRSYQFYRREYLLENDVYRLTKEIYPNAVVLSDSYAQMIGQFNDSVKVEA